MLVNPARRLRMPHPLVQRVTKQATARARHGDVPDSSTWLVYDTLLWRSALRPFDRLGLSRRRQAHPRAPRRKLEDGRSSQIGCGIDSTSERGLRSRRLSMRGLLQRTRSTQTRAGQLRSDWHCLLSFGRRIQRGDEVKIYDGIVHWTCFPSPSVLDSSNADGAVTTT